MELHCSTRFDQCVILKHKMFQAARSTLTASATNGKLIAFQKCDALSRMNVHPGTSIAKFAHHQSYSTSSRGSRIPRFASILRARITLSQRKYGENVSSFNNLFYRHDHIGRCNSTMIFQSLNCRTSKIIQSRFGLTNLTRSASNTSTGTISNRSRWWIRFAILQSFNYI